MKDVKIYFIDNIKNLLLLITNEMSDQQINEIYTRVFEQFEVESLKFIENCIQNTEYPYSIPESETLKEFVYEIATAKIENLKFNELSNIQQEYLIWLLCVILYCWENDQTYMFFGYSLKQAEYQGESVVYLKDALIDETSEEMIQNYRKVLGIE